MSPEASFTPSPEDESQGQLSGRLDAMTIADLWSRVEAWAKQGSGDTRVMDLGAVTYCDGAGAGLLLNARQAAKSAGRALQLRATPKSVEEILSLVDQEMSVGDLAAPPKRGSLAHEIGAATAQVWADAVQLAEFTGEVTRASLYMIRRPRALRWTDVWRTAEIAGANALPVVLLVGFLIGFVMAFQSAIPMRQFGADVFIPTLIGLAMFRELGPIMTGVALAGRSSSAFAAELGTMKVNEEISALVTMGLEPAKFLVVPRILAAVLMTPILTVFGTLAGVFGGFIVFISLGYPAAAFFSQLTQTVGINDFVGGVVKGFVFGIVVAGIGCMKGLQTKTGASAVGDSTTSAVVSSIVFIAIGDGIFAMLYYALGV